MSIKPKVLEVSDKLFAKYGYVNVSMSKMSTVSGVSIGSIYNAFKRGKEEIADQILTNYFNELIKGFSSLLNQETIDLSLESTITKLITMFVELNSKYQSSPELQRIVINQDTTTLSTKIREEIESKFALFLRLKIPNLKSDEATLKSKISYILCNSIFDEWENSHDPKLIQEMEKVLLSYLKSPLQ